ncbi:MAG: class I SAM-dependent methyltransferase [Proteobacteria bacterium]|nr:class I SAM-dependent methyltransferase [Pseudomonadota bacterium]
MINSSRLLLSRLRGGDYAHAGDREATHIVLKQALSFDSSLKNKAALDVGCGFGGTAQDLYDAGFTHVHGIDLDPAAILYAQNKYPALNFTVADGFYVDKKYPLSHFSFVSLFNVMYAIQDTAMLLKKLSAISQPKGILVIFDYTCEKSSPAPFLTDLADKPMYPLHREILQEELKQARWDVLDIIDMTSDYIRWYRELLKKLSTSSFLFEQEFSAQDVSKVRKTFTMLLSHLEQGIWGGAAIYARNQNDWES